MYGAWQAPSQTALPLLKQVMSPCW